MSQDVFKALEAARRDGQTVVMGTTVRTEGDPPSAPGNRALFGPDGALLAGTSGGGPVADALASIGEVVGLAVRAEAPGTAEFTATGQGLGPGDAVVFVDHDDPELLPALIAVLTGRAGYVGVMGSRRHTPGFVKVLRDAGVDVRRLRSPTGLDLGARRPPEIALSILAEVMAATRGRPGGSLDIVHAEKGPE